MSERLRIPRWEQGLLVVILILALGLRAYRLPSIPPGLTHDEASNAHDAAGVLQGVCPIYFTGAYGHEPLYAYSAAPLMALLGATEVALRLTTVAWGLALVLLTYGYARRVFGPLPSVLAAGWLAVSFWGVMTSRVGLRAVTLATTFTASALCFWLGLPIHNEREAGTAGGDDPPLPSRLAWLLAGLCLGASLYTYMASRVTPAVYFLFLIYLLLLRRRGKWGDQEAAGWRGALMALVVAGILVMPLVHFLIMQPAAEQRIDQLSAPLRKAALGNWRPLGENVSEGVMALIDAGDTMWRYAIPGRPLIDAGSRIFLLIGVVTSLWHWRDGRYAFLLLWLSLGLAPALVVGAEGITLRAVGAQPAIAVMIGLGLSCGIRVLTRLIRDRVELEEHVAETVCAVLFVVGIGVPTGRDYFRIWGEHREVRVTYYHALVEQARYLDVQREGGAVALSTQYPDRLHDPYVMDIVLRRDDLDLRWFHGGGAVVLPAAENARMIIPALASSDETLRPDFLTAVLQEHASLVDLEHLGSHDLIPSFEVYRVDVAGAVETLLSEMGGGVAYWSVANVFPEENPQALYEPLAFPVAVGDVAEFVGYAVSPSMATPNESLEVLTVWRVMAPFDGELTQFTHLLDHAGKVVSQVDRLDAPSWQWRAGDIFVQRHRLQVDEDEESGFHHLQVGFYTQADVVRLPVIVDGAAKDDRILLQPVQIGAQ